MLFKRVKIKNIRSYEDAEINFPSGSILLSGDIGSGKTTILLAIEFALFGLQPGQRGASLLRNSADEGMVELEFEIDGKNVIITRILKKKKTISQEATFISIDGKKQEKSIAEIKNDILVLLEYPQEFAKKTNLLYKFTVYTPQEEMKQIILESPEIRLNTLRHIFGIDKYKRIKENTAILTTKMRENVRMKQGQIFDMDFMNQRLNEKSDFLLNIEKQIPDIDDKSKKIASEKLQKEQEIKEIRVKIEEKKRIENEIEKIIFMTATKKEQVFKINKDISDTETKFKNISREFNQSYLDKIALDIKEKKQVHDTLNKNVIEVGARINSLEIRKKELSELKCKIINLRTCPTCLQYVGEEHKQNILSQAEGEDKKILKEKSALENEKDAKKENIGKIDYEIRQLEKSKSELEIMKLKLCAIEDDTRKIEELKKQKSAMENDISLLDEQTIRLKQIVSDMKKFDKVANAYESEFSEILEKQKQIEIKKAQIIKEIELGKREIIELRKQIGEKEKIKNELVYLMELEGWFSSKFLDMISFIEKNVMVKLRDEFSKLFSEWFSILVPDTFIVSLDEEFTPIIKHQDYDIDYAYLSGGERTAVALAYRLALNQTINSAMSKIKTKGIVILDEPTDGFSQQQLDKMRDVLQELNASQLIIVSHDQKMESFVDNIIKLKRDGMVTKINDE